MNIGEMLDAAKEATGASSDMELAKKLGLTRNAVSNYRTGVSLPKASVCEKIARIIGKSPLSVIAAVEEKRAISSEDKAVWRRLASAAVLVISMVPALSVFTGPEGTVRATLTGVDTMHYAKSKIGMVFGTHYAKSKIGMVFGTH